MLFRRMMLLGVLLLGANRCAWAENIEEAMTPDEFKAAGLEKLSADELARLNAWLQRSAAAPAASAEAIAAPAPTPAPVASKPVDNGPHILAKYRKDDPKLADEDSAKEIDEINSRIVGYFEGWRKGTVFKLENGQHWRVTDDRRFDGPSLDGPMAHIKSAFMGSWLLKIEGYNRAARVQRVK